MLDKVIINKLECFGKHGVFKEENVLGQKFVVSAEMLVSRSENDDLATSVNYGEVSLFIDNIVRNKVFKLIETLAENIAEGILKNFNVHEVTVKVEKPWAPVGLPLKTVSVEITREWHTAYIALGSNLGDKQKYLDDAVQGLADTEDCIVEQVSDYLVTEPYGGVEQDVFLNGALKLRTLLTPEELLDRLHELEQAAHRERIVHWGPRTLDLDILLYDQMIIDTPVLHVPHIDMENRDFVLIPLTELAPYYRHPVLNKTISQLLKELQAK